MTTPQCRHTGPPAVSHVNDQFVCFLPVGHEGGHAWALRRELDSNGADRIAAERQRQVDVEGWTDEHDDGHDGGELLMAASAYAWAAQLCSTLDTSDMTQEMWQQWRPDYWPPNWHPYWWNPSNDPIPNAEKAGALIAAEIDRLLRTQGATP